MRFNHLPAALFLSVCIYGFAWLGIPEAGIGVLTRAEAFNYAKVLAVIQGIGFFLLAIVGEFRYIHEQTAHKGE